jgi:hypothetical protein
MTPACILALTDRTAALHGRRQVTAAAVCMGKEPMMSVLTAGAPPRGRQRYQLESGLKRMTPAERAAG